MKEKKHGEVTAFTAAHNILFQYVLYTVGLLGVTVLFVHHAPKLTLSEFQTRNCTLYRSNKSNVRMQGPVQNEYTVQLSLQRLHEQSCCMWCSCNDWSDG